MGQSQNEEKNSWYHAFENLKHGIFSEMDTAFLATIIKYNKDKHIADIQPLNNLSDGQTRAQLLSVPVAENCYIVDEILENMKPEFIKIDANSNNGSKVVDKYPKKKLMRVGVVVICVCLDRDADNWNGQAQEYSPNTGRTHSMNDAIIVGVLGGNGTSG